MIFNKRAILKQLGGRKVNVKTETNSKSIISLIFGILSILIPLVGLILGILGIVTSRNATREIAVTNENGKGLAVAGLTCSIIGIGLQVIMIVSYIVCLRKSGISRE